MGSPALPILFLILHLAAGVSPAPSYVVTAPAVMYHPYPATLWVHLSGLSEPVQVTIELQRRDGTQPITLLKTEVQEHQVHLNITFPTPAPTNGKEEDLDMSISIHGSSLNVSEKKIVMLKAQKPGIFIQTDKALYKPGQEVKFRVVSLDKDLIPSNEKLPLVFLEDPHGNRIAQWQDVSPRQGIVDLFLLLAKEPALGTYTIHVEGKTHSFRVEEYVLPKFEVTINLPSVVLEKDKKFQMEICGRYTYGKPVHGSVQASLCHYPQRHISEGKACTNISGQTEKNGCFSTEVLLSTFNMAQWMNRTLEVQASLEEDGTDRNGGLEVKSTKSIEILPEGFTITFEYPNEVYKPGIPYSGTFLLKGADGMGVPQRQILLSVSIKGKEDQTHTMVTDGSGRASFKLDTSGWTGHVSVKGEVNRTPQTQNDDSTDSYSDAQMKIMPFYSESGSFLEIRQVEGELPSGKPYKLWADFIFSQKALETELKTVDVIVLVTAKGTIANVLRKQLPAKAGVRDSFYVEVPISLELAPMAMALCYVVLPNGEMVADSMELYVAKSLPNKVKMAFSEDRALPGTALQLHLEAAPGSLCATRAVDRSVLLLEPEAELSAEAFYKVLPEFRAPRRLWDITLCDYAGYPYMETYKLFKGVALKLFTNAKIGFFCSKRHYLFTMVKAGGPTGELITFFTMTGSLDNIQESKERTNSSTDDQKELPAARMYFPETWLWDLVPVGEGGSAEVTVTVPDAITEWKAQTFCTAPQGLGLSPAITLTVEDF